MKPILLVFLIVFLKFVTLSAQTWDSLYAKAEAYEGKGDYSTALEFAEKALKQAELQFGKADSNYGNSLSLLASLYHTMGNNNTALSLYNEALKNAEISRGKDHCRYGLALSDLASVYMDMGLFEEALTLTLEAIKNVEKSRGTDHSDYGTTLHMLSILYMYMGRYEEALPIERKALEIAGKSLGKDHPHYGFSLNTLAILYKELGRYDEALPLYLEALENAEKNLGKDHVEYGSTLQNLAILYSDMGRYEDALPLYREALENAKNSLGKNNLEYGQRLSNMAVLYKKMGHMEEALPLVLEALENVRKNLGTDHWKYWLFLNSLAALYTEMGRYEEALTLALEARENIEKNLGKDHVLYRLCLTNLAALYRKMGLYEESLLLALEVLESAKKNLGAEHPDYSTCLHNVTATYNRMKRYEEVPPLYFTANQNMQVQIQRVFSISNEKNKVDLLNTMHKNFQGYHSFAYITHYQYDSLNQMLYDDALILKELVLNSTQDVFAAIEESQDTALSEKFALWKNLRSQLTRQYSKPVNKRISNIDSLERVANEWEGELVRKSSAFAKAMRQVNMSDVRSSLHPTEAAIEFVSFRYYNPDPTDSIFYIALLLRNHFRFPEVIHLFEEKQLDSIVSAANTAQDFATVQNLYTRGVSLEANSNFYGKELYEIVWGKIEPHLKGANTIYYSPSGKLNKISFAAIPMNEKQLLSDKYNLVSLSSTRELVNEHATFRFSDNNAIALFGGIQYDVDTSAMKEASAHYQLHEPKSFASRSLPDDAERGGTFTYLNSTLKEVEEIQKMFSNNQTFTKAAATEDALKSLQADNAPDVLHIATHGFFYKENDIKKDSERNNVFESSADPLLRSGLILAGGNHKWKGETIPEGVEDGILTAKEVAGMNLNNTKLVVLSACETGLGDIKGSEGVYGLQRAFKAAGADYLMMSLWQVPDKETQDFMTAFYRHCKKGSDIQTAFHFTQAEMKKKYKDPYKWAAFVMVR